MIKSYETDIFEKTVIDLLEDIKKELQNIGSILEPKKHNFAVIMDNTALEGKHGIPTDIWEKASGVIKGMPKNSL